MSKFHLPTIEEDVLKKWSEKDIYKRLVEDRKNNPAGRFVFFEGPPTANGKPGIHHMLTRAFKDVVVRYWTQRGYHIDRKAGWDTHGLPVELEVEKKLGFTKKQDIEDYGIAKFNEECKKSVWVYRDLWEKMTRRMGYWIDLDDPYVTYENNYVESLWSIMKKIDADGHLYKGFRITPHCPRCVTSLSSHELAQGYKDVDDPSVFIKFKLVGNGNRYLLVWTTTPWTLPGNVAVAVAADVDYVEVKLADGETLIVARALLGKVDGEYTKVASMKGSDLVGLSYEPLYATLTSDDENHAAGHKVYAADFVSTVDGTGLVHIAPAFGEDDGALGKAVGLPMLLTVNDNGIVTADVPGQGKFFKKADADIMADLTERGLLYKSGTINHSYPFCWRCDTPVLYYAKSSWYVSMSKLREELKAGNAQINWVPDNIKEGRFGEWLREAKDWAFSRERYWGTPLPIWICECGERTTIGSLAELEDKSPAANRIFMMRHGHAESNGHKVIMSLPETREFHLTGDGREQVAVSAVALKEAAGRIDAIYCSPLMRTRETAAIMAKTLGFDSEKIVYTDDLRELDFGAFNGKGEDEYYAQFSGLTERFEKPIEGGESLVDVRHRAIEFIKKLRSENAGKNILVVTHGDLVWFAKMMFSDVTDEHLIATHDEVYPRTGEWVEVKMGNLPYDRNGRVDVHRPYIDEVSLKCGKCGKLTKRIAEVADVWFDSGAMPYAQWHYPFENGQRIDGGSSNYPADYISEAIDQTRGWFYTLLSVSVLMGKKEPPFRNCIVLGHILDAKGKKMSKSKGNVVNPFDAFDQFGADAIRYYLYTINQPGEYKRFDPKAVEDITKKVFLILWNVLSFYQMFAVGKKASTTLPTEGLHVLDKWLIAELAALSKRVDDGMKSYDVVGSARAIGEFVGDLSTWYVRRSRDRFKAGGAEQEAAVATLGHVLRELALLMAPFTPFLGEELYREVGGEMDSVHLERRTDMMSGTDEALREKMTFVRQVVSRGLEARSSAGIAVRQALAKATLKTARDCDDWMREIIADELNVHEVVVEKASGADEVVLDTELTPALLREGAARDLVRNINSWRKESGLTIQDRIRVTWQGSEFWTAVIEERGAEIAGGTLCDGFTAGEVAEGVEISFRDEKIVLAPAKV